MKTPSAAVVTAILLLSACSKKHNDAATQPVIATPPSVVGEYSSACVADARNGSQLLDLNYLANGQMIQTTENFNDAACTQSAFAVQVTSTYRPLDILSPGILRVDYTPADVQLMPHTDRQAQDWNRGRGHCGINDWQEGRAKSVDAACVEGVETRPTFSIVKIDGNNIFLGQPNNRDEDGYSAERRFSKIDVTITYVKVGTPAPIQTNPVQGGVCPAFAKSYACESNGDEAFAGRDLNVNANGSLVDVEIASRGGAPSLTLHFNADGVSRTTGNGHDFTDTTTSACANGELTSHDVVSRAGNSAAGSTSDFRFRANGDNLVIDTVTQMGTQPVKTARTFCRKL
jgi:hypothetical protein